MGIKWLDAHKGLVQVLAHGKCLNNVSYFSLASVGSSAGQAPSILPLQKEFYQLFKYG